ncbi:hydrogen peroxide-inducible genes activator [Cytophaga hutchinsonii]|jgi:LysR family hydrogen peroxide-inducible transcriptional activator|uniref:Redox-sensitive transcriptional activator OxyR, LysR family n=1 Tax=Cytophaga hutchinsonii (strain ATCC 33406 / DSM 1761 / CIP 103989 / NBRC 15051 / NCIMB 9469 / D465) TaxID=269798 RepID=A0A6N4SWW4_CYTH3|nr:hydrogen peroxide-inducible genes activator [Cytophaga hutchinsonii]ABG60994.1 redox-sensitive transcriptional activator OxyR, LysR family [Cytophaga hutchinsonii ATCC 33406]SFX43964.1 LysR family transcriptional regulator, hydrogen peroxide-inducible genes activator [Cytophaga hutchinsonii ATCC 33406]
MLAITLTQLEYIVAVDTYRHFVTASEKCFVTQPTLSMQIKKLEDDLGVIIFDRTKQPIVPTEIGVKIIEQARITLSAGKKIPELIKENSNTVSGELTIGIIPSLAPYLLPRFIGNFTQKYPQVKVKIIELMTEEIIFQLKKDTLDVGILVTPLNEAGVIETPLFYEKMVLYIHKDHPLAKKKALKATDIATPDLWLLSKGHCFRSQVMNLCSYQRSAQNELPFEYESGSLETLKKFVEKEGGFTLLPELAIDGTMKELNAKVRQFETVPLREVSLAYTRNYSKIRLLALLEDEIKKSIPKALLTKDRGNIVDWR